MRAQGVGTIFALALGLLVLASGPAGAQALTRSDSSVELPVAAPPTAPKGLTGVAEPTLENAMGAFGNLARWRDEERGRIGLFLSDNAAENDRLLRQHQEDLNAWLGSRWRRGPAPVLPAALPEGPLLPSVRGVFLVRRGGGHAVVRGFWSDPESNPGDSSAIEAVALNPELYCGLERFALEDAAFLGLHPTPAIEALSAGLTAQTQEPAILYASQVQIQRRPDSTLFWRAYPTQALEREIEGLSSVVCTVTQGRLTACAVAAEEPADLGFGQAALALATEGFVIGPTLTDGGRSEGRRLCLPIAFRIAG